MKTYITMKHINFWVGIMTILCGIGCFIFFYQAYPYHLQHREQILLFTYTAEQLSSYFNSPAALSCLLGDFLTQFFHLKVVGPILVSVALMGVELMAFLTFRRWMNKWIALAIALCFFVWEGLKFCDIIYPLSGTISLLAGFTLFLCIAPLKGKWSLPASGLVGLCLGYYLFGYGLFVFTGCLAIESWIRYRRERAKNLLTEVSAPRNSNNFMAMLLGTIVLPVIAALLPYLTANHFLILPQTAYTYPATVWKGKPDFNNERILGLSTEYYHENWNRIIELAYQGTASNDVSICYNLANAMQGHLTDRLMYYYQPAGLALFMPIYEQSTYLSTQLAGEVWYQLGDMTMAEHAAILSMIFSPNNKGSRMVKRLAEINLINGEEQAAQKYLNILATTWAYKDWAKERQPGHESKEVKAWLAEKRQFLPQKDTLRLSATDVRKSLQVLLDSNADNRMARDYLLCFDLLMKDLPGFMADYQQYHKGKPNRLYSEALMIHLFDQHAGAKEVKAAGIHPSVIRDFNQYNKVYNQTQGNAAALKSRFARTYWFYFQFTKFN